MSGSMPNLPLYQPISQPDFSKEKEPNKGLWYDKFCNRWEAGWKSGLGKEGKVGWVNAFIEQDIGDRDLLEETVERHLALLKDCNGLALSFETQGPMVSGLGRSHPVENGFAWHHLLGVPFLPGSSVKGMVRSYATRWLDGQNKVVKADLMRIFGPRDGSIHVGSVIFMDALPILPVRLKADVMTPHYNPYYAGADEPPGDWHSPVPIPFLAVDEGQEFLFGILPRRPLSPEDKKDCIQASGWLSDALDVMGAGAKTSSGYGRFSKVDLKNKGMRWLAWLSISMKQGKDVAAFLNQTPTALDEWSKIENPEVKCEVAKEMNRLYQTMAPRGSIRRNIRVLEEYFKTAGSCQEDTE